MKQDQVLTERIQEVFRAHRGRYGCPRVQRALQREGCRVSRRRIARLMRRAGLRARVSCIYRSNAGLHRFFGRHPHRLPARPARMPDRVWVGDVTYIKTRAGWRFLAVVIDQCSRRVLAWRLGARRDSALTLGALAAAVRRRRPRPGLVFHSDRGSEYAAFVVQDRLSRWGILQSATRRGPEDNAHMESFFHSLKAELIHGAEVVSEAVLRCELRRYVHYYNHERQHSALAYRSPVEYESL